MRKWKMENRYQLKVGEWKIIFVLIAFLFSILNSQLSISTATAVEATPSVQVSDIGYSRIDPTSPFYFLKTIRENIEMKLAQTERVEELRKLEFATRRLREVRTIIGKNEDLIPPTLDRYSSYINSLDEKYIKNDKHFADDIKNNLVIHLQNLQQFHDLVSLPRTKMSIRMAMYRIVTREGISDLAKLPVCNFFAKEASSSALNQTEQYVLRTRAQECISHLR